MSNDNNSSRGGTGVLSLLTIAFVVLKLVGEIDWSWLWVLSPIWIPLALAILIGIIIYVAKKIHDDRNKSRWRYK